MEFPSCDYCGSPKYTVFLNNIRNIEFDGKFRLVKCRKCGLIYLNPRPTKKEISKYYPTKNYWSENGDSEKSHGYLYKFLLKYVSKGKVLDVGAGTGVFLSGFKKRGWKIDGVELSLLAVSVARRKFKINLRKGDLLDLKLPENKFDLVTLNHVLEHVYEPRQTLMKVSKLLKKGGIVMISCPNIEAIGADLFKGKWYAIDAPRHLYQFSSLTIVRMLKESGFKIAKINCSFYWYNFYVIFESFRRAFSPRFNKKIAEVYKPSVSGVKIRQSMVKKAEILSAKLLSGIIALVGPVIGRGEIVTILAVKV